MKEILSRYYCDRCGKEIPKKKSSELRIGGCAMTIQICTDRWNYIDFCDSCKDSWNYIDLCDSCIDSLEKWFLMRGDRNGKT